MVNVTQPIARTADLQTKLARHFATHASLVRKHFAQRTSKTFTKQLSGSGDFYRELFYQTYGNLFCLFVGDEGVPGVPGKGDTQAASESEWKFKRQASLGAAAPARVLPCRNARANLSRWSDSNRSGGAPRIEHGTGKTRNTSPHPETLVCARRQG